MHGAVCHADASDLLARLFNRFNIGIQVDGDAHFLHEFAEPFSEVIHAATDIPQSIVELDHGHEVHVSG